MDRNLLRRVEAATPVTQSELKKRILEDLELYWSDNNLAWDMLADGTYIQRKPSGNDVNAQKRLCQRLGLVVKE